MTELEVFAAAMDIEDAAARSAWLDRTCAGDGHLRRRIESLLHAHAEAGDFLDKPAGNLLTVDGRPDEDYPDLIDTPFRIALPGRLGVYELQEVIGQGGMGCVCKARHTRLDRTVALKVLHPERLLHPQAEARFDREMKAIGKLNHPHLVQALDAGECDGRRFLVMEYVDGIDLARFVRSIGPLAIADACEIVRQAALGLQVVHEHGMVHRDIKPSNLILAPAGTVKILDLGLALFDEEAPQDHALTSTNQVMGTLSFMAPEQCSDSHGVDIRADIYSLGATLYFLLAGVAPFSDRKRNTVGKQIKALLLDAPTSIAQKRADLPADLVQLVDGLLAKDPAARLSCPQLVAAALEKYAADHRLPDLHDRGIARARETRDAIRGETLGTTPDQPSSSRHDRTNAVESGAVAAALASRSADSRRIARRGRAVLALGAAFLLGAVVFFLQTRTGVIRVQVNDPRIEVALGKGTLVVKGAGEKTITIAPGKNWLHVRHADFAFKTRQFAVGKGDKVDLLVEWHQGKIAVLKDGVPFDEAHEPNDPAPKPKGPVFVPPATKAKDEGKTTGQPKNPELPPVDERAFAESFLRQPGAILILAVDGKQVPVYRLSDFHGWIRNGQPFRIIGMIFGRDRQISDDEVEKLMSLGLPNLESVSFDYQKEITAAAYAHLLRHKPDLKRLTYGGPDTVPWHELAPILRRFEQLESLSLAGLADESWTKTIGAMQSVRSLRLWDTELAAAGCDELAKLPHLSNLTIMGRDRRHVELPRLMLLTKLPQLRQLAFGNYYTFTAVDARALQALLPHCDLSFVDAKTGQAMSLRGRAKTLPADARAITADDGWVDILPLMDLVRKKWKRNGRTISHRPGGGAVPGGQFVSTGMDLPKSYALVLEVEFPSRPPSDRDSIQVLLPCKDRCIPVQVTEQQVTVPGSKIAFDGAGSRSLELRLEALEQGEFLLSISVQGKKVHEKTGSDLEIGAVPVPEPIRPGRLTIRAIHGPVDLNRIELRVLSEETVPVTLKRTPSQSLASR